MANQLDGDTTCNGTFSPTKFNCPAGAIGDAAVTLPTPGTGIAADKVIHQVPLHVEIDPGTAVTALTKLIHTVQGSNATVVAVDVMTPTPATGADRTVTVDLQKGNTASAFASILSAPVTLNSSTTARTPKEGAIASATLADDDSLQVVISVAGAAGNQAQGLLVTVTIAESPT